MLLGIIIGICIWQLVVGIAQFFDFDEDWVVCPLFCILLVVVQFALELISAIQNWRVCVSHQFKNQSILVENEQIESINRRTTERIIKPLSR